MGRDRDLAELEGFIDALATGPGRLLVEGDPGIGKTTLWRAAVDTAERRGYRVLACCPAESESQLAYAGLGDLLAGVDAVHFEGLPGPQRAALDTALMRAPSGGAAAEPRAIFAGFGGVLRALAREVPVLVAVDDRQWLDGGSRRALEFVARRLADERVGLLAAARRDGHSSWASGPGVVRVGPLSPAALHQLIKAQAGVSLPRPSVLRVHRMTEGNPLFALQIVAVLVSDGLPDAGAAWPVPDDLQDSVAARLQMLPAPVRTALCAAAATARATISGLDAPALHAAERAGIVTIAGDGRVRFAHPLFASAIYRSTTAAERRRVHAELAGQADDVEERARHLALACAGPDERVAALLDRAADAARARGAPDLAAELAGRASTLTPPEQPALAWQRRLTCAEHCVHAGDLPHARDLLLELVADPAPGPGRSVALRLLGEVCYRLGALDDALRFLGEAVQAAEGDPAPTARAEMSLAFALFYSFSSFDQAAAATGRALTLAEGLPEQPGLLASALAAQAASDLVLGRGLDEQRIGQALALEDHRQLVPVEWRASLLAGNILLETEQLDRARVVLQGLRTRLVERGQDSDLPDVLALLARLECLAGNLDTAAELADSGYDLARQEGSDSRATHARATRALIHAHRGDEQQTRTVAAEAIQLAAGSGWQVGAFMANTALGLLAVSLGNDRAAVSTLATSIQLVEQHGVIDPFRKPFLPDTIEALVHLGHLDRADRLTGQLEDCARALHRRTAIVAAARCRALIEAAHGQVQAALDALSEVLHESPHNPTPLEHARTLIVKGQLERRSKHKREAATSLQHALQITQRIGAALWAEKARTELARPRPAGRTRRAHPDRGADRSAGRLRTDQPRRRRRRLLQPENRRGQHRPHLPQARHPLPSRTRRLADHTRPQHRLISPDPPRTRPGPRTELGQIQHRSRVSPDSPPDVASYRGPTSSPHGRPSSRLILESDRQQPEGHRP